MSHTVSATARPTFPNRRLSKNKDPTVIKPPDFIRTAAASELKGQLLGKTLQLSIELAKTRNQGSAATASKLTAESNRQLSATVNSESTLQMFH